MKNIGTITWKNETLIIQKNETDIYLSGYPIEQYPRELRKIVYKMIKKSNRNAGKP